MPQYLTPGVYVEEVPSKSKPIEGVGTSIAAFVGLAPGGPVDTPVQISNWGAFVRTFGDPTDEKAGPFMAGAYLAHAVYGFFHNGGNLCWVVRVGADSAAGAPQVGLPIAGDDAEGKEGFRAIALEGVEGVSLVLTEEDGGDDAKPKTEADAKPDGEDAPGEVPAVPSKTYQLVVKVGGEEREKHEGLSLEKGGGYILTRVNTESKLIRLEETTARLPAAQRVPKPGTYELVVAADGDATALTSDQVEGDVDRRSGMGGLAAIDEITMLCVPDIMTMAANDDLLRDLQGKMIAHCENAGDRMAILDAPPGMLPPDVLSWRMNKAGYDSKFATFYYPWIEVMDPISKKPIEVPPCGHVAGVWARTDSTRGIHKAPANEVILGANGLGFQVTQAEQGDLNKNGVNCIRSFPGRGIRIWGARTLSSDPEWRYLNVRRLFNWVSESILEGTQWAVFEPNDERLWSQLRIASSNFLTRVWRDGALLGGTPDQAFFVKCDAETNPPEMIEAGQVTVQIGIAPVKPAEFIVFQISQFQAGEAA